MEVRMRRGSLNVSLLALVALTAILGALGATGASAAPSFSVVSTTTTPDPVAPGATATITTSVKNSGSLATGIIVDMEVFNSAGNRVFQQYIPGNSFGTGETKAFQWFWSSPSNQAAGTYTVKIGVFTDHWVTLLLWNNSADTFTVGASTPGVAFAIGNISASPTHIQRGGTLSVTAAVTNTGTSAASGINVLLSLTDPLGNDFPGNQVIVENQSFAAGQTRTLTFQWTAGANATQGAYTVGIGAFNKNWSTLYAWKNSGSAFTVGTANTLTFSIGATSVSPNQVARGGVATVTTHVTNTSSHAAANIVVLCEINTADGSKNITSQYVTGLSFSPGQNRSFGFAFPIPGNMAPGTYTIDIGVFNNDWSTMYKWGFIVATFTVQ
jgi:hypothetical protein